jgi:TolB protein
VHPVFSPDGERILFSSNRGNADREDYDLYTMALDGSDVRRLTRGPDVDTYASYSPDGKRIVTRRVVDGNSEVFVMDADGGNPLNLSRAGTYDGWPAWSPDGNRIAFAGGQPGGEVFIYLVNPDGTGRVQLTDKPGSEDRHPAFSPDGKMLVFTRYRGGPQESSDLVIVRLPV